MNANVTVSGKTVTIGPDSASAAPGNPVTKSVLANDSSSSGQTWTNPTITTAPHKYMAKSNADCTITYMPTAN